MVKQLQLGETDVFTYGQSGSQTECQSDSHSWTDSQIDDQTHYLWSESQINSQADSDLWPARELTYSTIDLDYS